MKSVFETGEYYSRTKAWFWPDVFSSQNQAFDIVFRYAARTGESGGLY